MRPMPARFDPVLRPAEEGDVQRMQEIREAAFRPVFESFRAMLGDSLYELAQKREDQAQGELLESLLEADSGWEVHVAEIGSELVGFVAIKADSATGIGEIGLNAVDPNHAGRGVGTSMYEFAVARLRDQGMRVATVSTGGDPSHAPARRAYEKAGFAASIPSVWFCREL